MVTVTQTEKNFIFTIQGFHKIWALRNKIIVPKDNVIRAYQDKNEMHQWSGIRFGTYIPFLITAGTYFLGNKRNFWDVMVQKNVVIVELKNHFFSKLYIQVKNPEIILALLNKKNIMKKTILILILFFSLTGFTQEKNVASTEIEVNSLIKGTLFTPTNASSKTKLVILIAGSGPTNRSGNQVGLTNNSLKYLAEDLAQDGIAVFSYDKRIFAQIINKTLDENKLSFEDFINDAKDVVNYFKSQKKYSKILIAGHSEGSLIGMVAALNHVDGYISLAGAGRPINEVLSEQIAKNSPAMKEEVDQKLLLLKEGKTFENKNPMLASLFRESIQPYLISWIKYNPQVEIQKLMIPILIINGKKDIQVSPSDAELLKKAKPEAQLVLIDNMNHIFKEIKGDEAENKASYTNPDLPIIKELVEKMILFIKSI